MHYIWSHRPVVPLAYYWWHSDWLLGCSGIGSLESFIASLVEIVASKLDRGQTECAQPRYVHTGVDSLKAGGQTVWSHSTHWGLTGLLPQGWWSDCVEALHTQRVDRTVASRLMVRLCGVTPHRQDLTGLLPQGWWSDCVEPIHTQTTRRDRCLKTGGQTMWSHSTQRGPDGTIASRLVVRLCGATPHREDLTGPLLQGWWSDYVESLHTERTWRDRCLEAGGQIVSTERSWWDRNARGSAREGTCNWPYTVTSSMGPHFHHYQYYNTVRFSAGPALTSNALSMEIGSTSRQQGPVDSKEDRTSRQKWPVDSKENSISRQQRD